MMALQSLKARAADSRPRSPRFKFLGTNLDSFEANWKLELHPSLHLCSPNHELSFELFFFGSNQLIFPPKWCYVSLASICHFLVLDPHLNAMHPIFGSQLLWLFYFIGLWTWDLNLKWPSASILVGIFAGEITSAVPNFRGKMALAEVTHTVGPVPPVWVILLSNSWRETKLCKLKISSFPSSKWEQIFFLSFPKKPNQELIFINVQAHFFFVPSKCAHMSELELGTCHWWLLMILLLLLFYFFGVLPIQ